MPPSLERRGRCAMREWAGVVFFDLWRYARAISADGNEWMSLCNRIERLHRQEGQKGYVCDWRWSSDLHAPKVFPALGKRLLSKALKSFSFCGSGEATQSQDADPQIAFVIGHRGCERLPLLQMTLNSIKAQERASVECIVVEESTAPEVQEQLPAWVRYVHLPTANEEQPFNRSRVLNAGVQVSHAPLVVLHDNDMVCPSIYARELLSLSQQGAQVINLKRYIFYLRTRHTWRALETGRFDAHCTPEYIVQNLTGGASLAITKKAFSAIGGMDEDFVGWGGEDVDFWNRAQTLRVHNATYLPFLHLWHTPQHEKSPEKDAPAMQRLRSVSQMSIEERIRHLRKQRQKACL